VSRFGEGLLAGLLLRVRWGILDPAAAGGRDRGSQAYGMVPGPSPGVDRDFYRTFLFTTSLHSGRLAGRGGPQAPRGDTGRRKSRRLSWRTRRVGAVRHVGRERLRGRGLQGLQ
jgi:hypothetical protein